MLPISTPNDEPFSAGSTQALSSHCSLSAQNILKIGSSMEGLTSTSTRSRLRKPFLRASLAVPLGRSTAPLSLAAVQVGTLQRPGRFKVRCMAGDCTVVTVWPNLVVKERRCSVATPRHGNSTLLHSSLVTRCINGHVWFASVVAYALALPLRRGPSTVTTLYPQPSTAVNAAQPAPHPHPVAWTTSPCSWGLSAPGPKRVVRFQGRAPVFGMKRDELRRSSVANSCSLC